MSGFDSPLGKRNYNNNVQIREFSVGEDLPPNMNEINSFNQKASFEEMSSLKKDKMQGIQRLDPGAKRRIEILLGAVKTTREVDIVGNSYVLRTLRTKETQDAILAVSKFDGTVSFPYEIRKQMLSRSLVSIGGVDFDQFVGSSNLEDKCNFLDELDEALCNRLYDEYLILVDEVQNKYRINSKEDAEKVAEDLKK